MAKSKRTNATANGKKNARKKAASRGSRATRKKAAASKTTKTSRPHGAAGRATTALAASAVTTPEADAARRAIAALSVNDRRDEIRDRQRKASVNVRAVRLAQEADYEARLKSYASASAPSVAAAAPLPRIVAEGDSWFAFPWYVQHGGSVIDHLQRLFDQAGKQVAMLNISTNGDEAKQMLSRAQHERLYKLLSDPALRPDVLLFSAGGNDLVGDALSLWLRHKVSAGNAAQALHAARVDAVLGVIRGAYEELMALRDSLAANCWIVSHGYAVPYASGVGVCWVIDRYRYGPWLKPSLDYRGWTHEPEQRDILRQLLLQLRTMLLGFHNDPTRRFKYVETQALLPSKSDWHDELHPSETGFAQVANEFYKVIAPLI